MKISVCPSLVFRRAPPSSSWSQKFAPCRAEKIDEASTFAPFLLIGDKRKHRRQKPHHGPCDTLHRLHRNIPRNFSNDEVSIVSCSERRWETHTAGRLDRDWSEDVAGNPNGGNVGEGEKRMTSRFSCQWIDAVGSVLTHLRSDSPAPRSNSDSEASVGKTHRKQLRFLFCFFLYVASFGSPRPEG